MTEQKIEYAARILCKIRGLDPDESVKHAADPSPSGYVCDICLISPRWRLVAREIVVFEEVRQALETSRYT